MATAPEETRVEVSGGPLVWGDGAPVTVSDGPLLGVGVERHLLGYFSVRLGFAYGGAEISDIDRSTDVRTYLAEVLLGGRLALPSLRDAGVVPFASAGIGSLLHDPAASDLGTRSQNAFSWGGGLDVRLGDRLGARAEWRRYTVRVENVFEPTNLDATSRNAQRILASLYWEF